jgi:hypothetical protein
MALPSYLQDTGTDLAKQMTGTYSVPIDTTKFTGRQFVAGEDPLQTSAIGRVTSGLDSYKPYLTQAQSALTAQGGLTGASAYQQFQSPYQQQVIDETLRQYDISRGAGEQQIKDAAVASGNFGGGREGAMLGQYMGDTLANRAGIRSGLLQQGFQNAQQAAQQAFQNQGILGAAQMGLSNFERAGMGQDIGALGQMGAIRQGQEQARLTADQQMHQTAAYEPYGRLNQYASGITGLAGGMAAPQYAQQGPADPWGGALSTALGIGGLFAKMPWGKTA